MNCRTGFHRCEDLADVDSFVEDYSGRSKDFAPERQIVTEERQQIHQALDAIMGATGIDKTRYTGISIEVGHGGAFSVSGIEGKEREALESALMENKEVVSRMLKNSAAQASLDLGYVKETEESLAIEMTLLDSYIREEIGYGIDDIDIFRVHLDSTDPKLKQLLAEDPMLDRQLSRIGEKLFHGFQNTFTARWSVS